MLGHVLLALMAVTQTDQTVQVQKGTSLDITNFAGEVAIKVWDRDAVRVEVQHSDRESVEIRPGDQRLVIRGHSRTGMARPLDYTISVPRWMAVSVTGTNTDVTMDGVGGDVSVETMRGDISVNGGSGFVSLKSVQGEISLRKASGRIDIAGVSEGIQLADITGDVSAQTINGSIILSRIDSMNVDLSTLNGSISYDGPIKDKGAYRLTTHNGTIGLAVPDKTNATLSVRTYRGGFRSSFPVKPDDQNAKKRFTMTFGSGSAHVELESFNGSIALRRPGDPEPEAGSRGRVRARQGLKH
jgi:putative adhesin